MVSEKDAAIKRVERRKAFREQKQKELEEQTIRFRWYVVERTPAYNTGGYYDQDFPAKNVKVSPDFDTKKKPSSG